MNRFMFCLSCCLFLSACSPFASNAETEYLKSNNGPLIQVPPPLAKQSVSQYYILPTPQGNSDVSIVPPK
ncbi:MAG: hypothetical protein NTW08_05460 [Gammaproteobacteria bacterium]|nr:hypothetical protein [Gammaproteobacteria bacterium]